MIRIGGVCMKRVLFYLGTIIAAIGALKFLLDFMKEQNVTEADAPVVKMTREYITLD